MQSANVPPDEAQRLAALQSLEVLDSGPEAELDALVRTAALVCGVPVSLISIVDSERQWFKANVGLPGVHETPRDVAFCSHAILSDELFVVPDAAADERFSDNPLVQGQPDIRFYAGAPLQLRDGQRVGTLCVIDRKPRQLSSTQLDILKNLALAAEQALEGRRAMRQVQRAMAEKEVSDAKFCTLAEHAPVGVFFADPQCALLYTNARWQEICGLNLQESLGMGWVKVLHPQDHDAVLQTWAQAGQQKALEWQLDFRILRIGDAVHRVRARAKAVLDTDARVIGWVGSVEDLTEHFALLDQLAMKQDELQRLYESTPAMLHSVGPDDRILTVSDLWLHKMGYQRKDVIGHNFTEFLTADSRQLAIGAVIPSLYVAGRYDNIPYQIVSRTGEILDVVVSAVVERDAAGHPVRVLKVLEDVTLRLQAERNLREERMRLAEQHELLRVTLQSIGDAVITTDARGHVTWLNPVAERLTGWMNQQAIGRPLNQVFHIVNEETRAVTDNPVETCLSQGEVVCLANHTLLIFRDSAEFGIADSAAPIRNSQGVVLGAVLVFHDVTEQRRMSGEMRYRATHDVLTGLINRADFESRLKRVLHKAHEEGSEHALLYIDLDQFKLVNDACGHAVGDQLLQQVSQLLMNAVRDRDTLARLGGDEFAVILEHCSAEQASRVAQQICDRMDDFRFMHDGRRFRIGTSIGLVPVDKRWATMELILQAADTSCYAAKEAGRNRVHFWFDTDQAMRVRHGEVQWTTRIENALDNDGFVLFAQRIELLEGHAQGLHAEVLLRMKGEDGDLVLPGAFFPAAERFHLASRIDRWVLRHSLKWMANFSSLDLLKNISINLSDQSIGDRTFHRWAIDLFEAAGPEVCAHTCLEIAETAAVTNMADAALFIEQVRAMGLRLALDDFGAGASSFGYLKNLTVDFLKIDGQFIRDLIHDPLDDAAVRCFIDVARVLNVKTVAEFVDKVEIVERLRTIGADYIQGYLIHKPEPIENLNVLETRVTR